MVTELFHGGSPEQTTNRRKRTIYDEEGFPGDGYDDDDDYGDDDDGYNGDDEDMYYRRQQQHRRYYRQS